MAVGDVVDGDEDADDRHHEDRGVRAFPSTPSPREPRSLLPMMGEVEQEEDEPDDEKRRPHTVAGGLHDREQGAGREKAEPRGAEVGTEPLHLALLDGDGDGDTDPVIRATSEIRPTASPETARGR
jgi:hypothetical protein